MHIEQRLWQAADGWVVTRPQTRSLAFAPQLVFAFGSVECLRDPDRFEELRTYYPNAIIASCSTAGEILDSHVHDDTIVSTAVEFDKTTIRASSYKISGHSESAAAGAKLVRDLLAPDLKHIFVLSDGERVNGSELIEGLTSSLPTGVQLTGGLAGDGDRFERTLVGCNEPASEGQVCAIGFYGSHIRIGCGSQGGWDSFGPDRMITKSDGNVLHELDGHNALDLYKKYLGDMAEELPGAALLFPLSVRLGDNEPIVRTILSIDNAAGTMNFAGSMPEGGVARLMMANIDRLVDGAYEAAQNTVEPMTRLTGEHETELAILISCVGRKLVLDDRVEEEIETVREVIGPSAAICGFYSYGEISPFNFYAKCELHNQTMTITTLSES